MIMGGPTGEQANGRTGRQVVGPSGNRLSDARGHVAADQGAVVFLGDSITQGWGDNFGNSFPGLKTANRGISGDTTRGPLNICITVLGRVPINTALRRGGARAEDDIWVSGSLGDARLGLQVLTHQLALAPQHTAQALQRLHRPTPRIALGLALRGIASAAIDISDGLLGDLGGSNRTGLSVESGQVCSRSRCGESRPSQTKRVASSS